MTKGGVMDQIAQLVEQWRAKASQGTLHDRYYRKALDACADELEDVLTNAHAWQCGESDRGE
jgi:alcohol dehydrogenase YqhD (iron-dependent ADH family)